MPEFFKGYIIHLCLYKIWASECKAKLHQQCCAKNLYQVLDHSWISFWWRPWLIHSIGKRQNYEFPPRKLSKIVVRITESTLSQWFLSSKSDITVAENENPFSALIFRTNSMKSFSYSGWIRKHIILVKLQRLDRKCCLKHTGSARQGRTKLSGSNKDVKKPEKFKR